MGTSLGEIIRFRFAIYPYNSGVSLFWYNLKLSMIFSPVITCTQYHRRIYWSISLIKTNRNDICAIFADLKRHVKAAPNIFVYAVRWIAIYECTRRIYRAYCIFICVHQIWILYGIFCSTYLVYSWRLVFSMDTYVMYEYLIVAEQRIYAPVKHATIGSYNVVSPVRHKANMWTNTGLLSVEPIRTNLSKTWIKLDQLSYK